MDEIINYIRNEYNDISNDKKTISKCFEIDNIEYTIISRNDGIIISAYNIKSDRFVKLDTKKYSNFIENLKSNRVYIEFKRGIAHIKILDEEDVQSKIYGYCRVSSKGQLYNNSLGQQENEICSKYPGVRILREQFSGMTTDRPVFNKLLNSLKRNDILVVTKLDRLARNTEEGIKLVEELFSKGVSVHVLNIGLLEDTIMGKFFLTTLLAVAEMERNTIIERTQLGKAIAKTKEGYKEGRPKKFTKKQMDHALSLLTCNGGDKSYTEVVEITGISKSTLIRENRKNK